MRDHGDHRHGDRNKTRHRLGEQLANPLRHQLAKDDGQKGDDRYHDRGGNDVRGRALKPPCGQVVRQTCTEGRFADNPVQYTDRRDAHLHRRQKVGGVLHQLDGRTGALVTFVGKALQAALATGSHRKF